jgi:hypothetical protein
VSLTLSVLGPNPNRGLWESACESCPVFDACEGSDTAPCTCWRTGPERHACSTCSTLCLERSVKGPDGRVLDSFEIQSSATRDLQCVVPIQATTVAPLPLLIHYRTDSVKLPRLRVRWVAAELGVLLSRRTQPPRPSRHLRSPSALRRRLRAVPKSKVLGMLTGRDNVLEELWTMERGPLYDALHTAGASLVTGPTFSVCADSHTVPASHNVMMQLRHHRVLSEAAGAALATAPNIYWRTPRDMDNWVAWLSEHSHVEIVFRDFSRTKTRPNLDHHVDGLSHILSRVARPIHVLACGIGPGSAGYVVRALANSDATCSLVTAHPLQMAAYHRAYVRTSEGITFRRSGKQPIELALLNLKTIEDSLLEVASGLRPYVGKGDLSNALPRLPRPRRRRPTLPPRSSPD